MKALLPLVQAKYPDATALAQWYNEEKILFGFFSSRDGVILAVLDKKGTLHSCLVQDATLDATFFALALAEWGNGKPL